MRLPLTLMILLWAGMAQAQTLGGQFRTQANEGGHSALVQFYDCGGLTCGRMVRAFDAAGKEVKTDHQGRDIVKGMRGDGNGAYSGGTIWDPQSGKTYKSKLQLSGDSLKVTGCIAVLCRSQHWTRAK